MAHSTISKLGVGATQAGTAVTSTSNNKTVVFTNETDSVITLDLKCAGSINAADKGIKVPAKEFLNYTHVGGHGACVMENIKTSHGTAAQTDERIYIHHRV
jgi:hypothetical protein